MESKKKICYVFNDELTSQVTYISWIVHVALGVVQQVQTIQTSHAALFFVMIIIIILDHPLLSPPDLSLLGTDEKHRAVDPYGAQSVTELHCARPRPPLERKHTCRLAIQTSLPCAP